MDDPLLESTYDSDMSYLNTEIILTNARVLHKHLWPSSSKFDGGGGLNQNMGGA